MSRSAARRPLRLLVATLLTVVTLAALAGTASAQPLPPEPPPAPEAPDDLGDEDAGEDAADDPVTGLNLQLEGGADGLSSTVTTVLLLTVAAVAPLMLLMMTTFTRFVVVLGLARNGLGLQTIPPAQILVGLALFLAMFSMGPTLSIVNEVAVGPLLAGEIDALEAAEAGYEPMRDFMLSQTEERDLQMFMELSEAEQPENPDEIGVTTLVPAFVISELRTAFTIGFVVFVPFLIIDLVVAAVLMSMGMVMLPPVFVSLPLKLLLFVLVDGWALLSRSLVGSVLG